jgi:hypothetical protein
MGNKLALTLFWGVMILGIYAIWDTCPELVKEIFTCPLTLGVMLAIGFFCLLGLLKNG